MDDSQSDVTHLLISEKGTGRRNNSFVDAFDEKWHMSCLILRSVINLKLNSIDWYICTKSFLPSLVLIKIKMQILAFFKFFWYHLLKFNRIIESKVMSRQISVHVFCNWKRFRFYINERFDTINFSFRIIK